MANKSIIIVLNNKDSIEGILPNKSAKEICEDYMGGCKGRKVYRDTEGNICIDMKNVSAILINKIQKPKQKKDRILTDI